MFDVLDTGSVSVPSTPDERPGDALARPPLGKVLLERGLLTEEQLQIGLAQHQWSGRPLGEVLITLGFVSEPTVAQALATQHGGLLKNEYGYATGFDAELPVGEAQAPPVSPDPAPVREAAVIPLRENVRVEELERELASANGELAAATARIPALENELRALQLRLRTSDELAAVANRRIAELEAEVESARATLAGADALDRDLQEARGALGAAAARLEAQGHEHEALRAENARLATELAATAAGYRAAYARLQYLESAAGTAPAPAPEQPQPASRPATFTWQT